MGLKELRQAKENLKRGLDESNDLLDSLLGGYIDRHPGLDQDKIIAMRIELEKWKLERTGLYLTDCCI